jgi:hypothetical protein
MWGRSIVGFGTYHYRYASGREGDLAATSFSPRKDATVLYLMDGVDVHAEIVRRSYESLTAGDAFGRRLSGPHTDPPG